MAADVDAQLRADVARRADHRCEYCLIHEDDVGFHHHLDHIISRKHGGQSTLDNLALACFLCNRRKGSDVASIHRGTGEIVRLFHPRRDRWSDHFRIEAEIIEALTDIGRVTLHLLKLNEPERAAERRLLQALGAYPTA